MKRKLLFFGLILALLALPLVACAKPAPTLTPTPTPTPKPTPTPTPTPTPPPTPPSQAKITWTFATFSGATTNAWPFYPIPVYQSWLEEMSGGRLVLDTKVELVPSAEVIMAAIDGRIEMGHSRMPWVSGTFPQLDFASLPFYFTDQTEYYRALIDPDMQKLIAREYDKVGLVYLGDTLFEPENGIWAQKPVAKVDDFKGIKIRTSGFNQTNTLKALGASPLTIATAELADAIKRGTVDAATTSVTFGAGVGLLDVTSYVSLWLVTSGFGCTIVVNKAKFNALPKDLQDILKQWGQVVQKAGLSAGYSHYITTLLWLKRAKMNVITPDKAEIDKAGALAKTSITQWLEKSGAVGKEILAIAAKYGTGPSVK